MPEEHAQIVIQRPKGCDKTSLSINALDARTRELAFETYVRVDGKMIPCESLAVKKNAAGRTVLVLEVQDGYFSFD